MNANEVLQNLLETFVIATRLKDAKADMPKEIVHDLATIVSSTAVVAIELLQKQYKIPNSELDLRLEAIDEHMARIHREYKNND